MAARAKGSGEDDPAVPNWDDIAREFRLAYSEWYSYAAVEIRFASTGLGEPQDVIGTRYAPQRVYTFHGFGHARTTRGIDVVRYVMLLAPPNATLGGGECDKVLDLVCGAGRLLRTTRKSDGEADAIRWFDRLLEGSDCERFTATARNNADKPIQVGVRIVRDLVRASVAAIAEIQRRARPTREEVESKRAEALGLAALGLSVTRIAERTGVARQSIHRWKNVMDVVRRRRKDDVGEPVREPKPRKRSDDEG